MVVPVTKKKEICQINNYRGITLTSILSKTYSHILDNRLRSRVDDINIFNECQFGFMQIESTIDCLFILQSIVKNQIYRKRKLHCAFIDFQMAFDLIYRMVFGINYAKWVLLCGLLSLLKEKDQKQLNRNRNESVSETKMFGANFMQIRL